VFTLLEVSKVLFALLSLTVSGTLDLPAETVVNREACILIDYQTVIFLENGREQNIALVSTGKERYDTPVGVFPVLYRYRAPLSSSYNIRMPYWVCIDPRGGIGMHQTFRTGVNNLGTRQSHGCIRMGEITASWCYQWIPTGAPVRIQAEGPRTNS